MAPARTLSSSKLDHIGLSLKVEPSLDRSPDTTTAQGSDNPRKSAKYHHLDHIKSSGEQGWCNGDEVNGIHANPGSRIESLEGVTEDLEKDKLEPIAVIGLGCRLPQDAASPEAFWRMLVEARSAMTEVPKDRFDIDAFYDGNSNRPGMMNARGGHFIKEDLACFDAAFFSIAPNEAKSLDPQQRWLLETTYEALENAGIPMDRAVGSDTSVYVGAFTRDYEALMGKDPELANLYRATGVGTSMLANRMSWFYNFSGPSMVLDTACSSSLTALHIACQSLRSRESSMALVCGCNLIFNPEVSSSLSDLNFLSPDSKCYSFDHRANGYSRGEGFGVVVLKPLVDAIRDDNTIRAVIRATAVNQDGRTPGITQPSSKAQEAMIRQTYRDGGMNMGTTRFVEAHGTGTALGDPLEAKAIYNAFKGNRPVTEPLYIGAVKSNIGHLEGASGIAGLIKAITVLEKGVIPPNVWFERPNPMIEQEAWNLAFPLGNLPWPTSGLRRASVNSFGYGGANAHAVLDDAYHYQRLRGLNGRHITRTLPPTPEELDSYSFSQHVDSGDPPLAHDNGLAPPRPRLLVWSTSDEDGLNRLLTLYREYICSLNVDESPFLRNLAHTLSRNRSSLSWRSYTITDSIGDLRSNFRMSTPRRSLKSPKLAFIFTGQGAQWCNMGLELLDYPVYRDSLQAAERYFYSLGCQWSLLGEMYKSTEVSNLDYPAYSQPICTALQIALVDLLFDWNITPTTVVGHSSGEIAAAYCVGGLSRESAWKVAYYRGLAAASILHSSSEATAMMSVGLSRKDAQSYIDRIYDPMAVKVSIGCINSHKNVTLTGLELELESLQEVFEREGIFCRKLKMNIAYHSEYMDKAAFIYGMLIQDLKPGKSCCSGPMISSVTGHIVRFESLSEPRYWIDNMVSPVRFSDAVSQICAKPSKQIGRRQIGGVSPITVDHAIEIGPHATLKGPLMDIFEKVGRLEDLEYSSLLRRGQSALLTTLGAVGSLHCTGYQVDLHRVNERSNDTTSPQMLTDLPSYPFNHTKKYWFESRSSRSYRFRKFPHHELLGTRDSDCDPLEAKWRNRMSTSDMIFVQDHKVNGVEVYPAAGMLVMAIEAIRQLGDPNEMITGYRFRDVTFHKAMIVPSDPEGVETQFFVRPAKDTNKNPTSWSSFRLHSYQRGEWDEICQGEILVEYAVGDHSHSNEEEELRQELQRYRQTFEDGDRNCKKAMSSKRLYDIFARQGLLYGQAFQSVSSVYFNPNGEATASVNPQQWKLKLQHDGIRSHFIHPTALDGVLQVAFPALTEGGKHPIPTMVPTKVHKLWLSASHDYLSGSKFIKTYAKSNLVGFRNAMVSIVSVQEDGQPCATIEGEMTFVAGKDVLPSKQQLQRFYNLEWRPDLDLLDKSMIEKFSSTETSPTPLSEMMGDEKEAVCLLTIHQLIQDLNPTDLIGTSHMAKYYDWMHYRSKTHAEVLAKSMARFGVNGISDNNAIEGLLKTVERQDVEGKLIARVARSLGQILRGQIDPLDLLFRDSLIQDYYRCAHDAPYVYNRTKTYIDAMAHKNPGLKVLEIGAGTGSATGYVIDALTYHDGWANVCPRFSDYTFTDISPSFFEKAKEKYDTDRMTFKTLDIEKDPLLQGFKAANYDLIIAANVLHATSELDVTLQNTRKLLRPGGKLILFEGVNPDRIRISFIFGLLSGWWLGTEDHRRWGPMMSREMWNKCLLGNGFSGVDALVSNYEDSQHQLCSAMITTAEPFRTIPPTLPKTVIAREEGSAFQCAIANKVKYLLESRGHQDCHVLSLEQWSVSEFKQAHCVFLPELEQPYLHGIDRKAFGNLQDLANEALGILWLTHTDPTLSISPRTGVTVGLSRCVSMEHEGFRFVTLNIESLDVQGNVDHIINVLDATLYNPSSEYEREYAEMNGRLCISRVAEADYITKHVFERTALKEVERQQIGQDSTQALRLTIGTVGLLDTLRFEEDIAASQALAADEVEIDTKAVGVNFRDVLVSLGQVASDYFGNECAGIITRVGGIANSKFKVGDRVVCALSHAFRTRNRCVDTAVSLIPPGMDFATAAAIPVAFCTAYYCTSHWARLKPGETILIHSAAGGFGQAVVQLALMTKAEIFITVGTEEKKKAMMDLYKIPEDHIFSSRNSAFAKGIHRMTNGRGVDVVINSLTGENLRSSWECIAPFGRFIEVGKKDIYATGTSSLNGLYMRPFARNVMFASVDLALIIETNPRLLGELMQSVMSLASSEQIHAPLPLHKYKASNIEDAFRYMQSGKHWGKLVIDFEQDSPLSVVPSSKAIYTFDPNATYLIAGGLGGIGRSLARWMVSREARNLILLSRSTTYNQETEVFLQELRDQGVKVATPPCDVSDSQRLTDVLEECSRSMPPIKGCIQGSMVLQNAMFKNMPIESFEAALRPKVQGSWNLHNLLPAGMDFFILLSSYAGIIGSVGQSNYSCGNTYQDALARHRVANGEKAVALDLGMVESVGIVSEHPDLMEFLQSTGHEALAEAELHALVEYYCDPHLPLQSPRQSQVIASLELPATLHSKDLVDLPWMSMPLFKQLWQIKPARLAGESEGPETGAGASLGWGRLLADVKSTAEAADVIWEALRSKLTKMLGVEPGSIDVGRPLHTYGVDSLVAIELRNWFGKTMGADVAVFQILNNGSAMDLVTLAARKSSYVVGEASSNTLET